MLEWKFPSLDIGYKILKGEDSKYLLGFFKKQIQAYHGDYGVACVQHSLTVKYHNVLTFITIVRCPRQHYCAVWSALSGITAYKKEPCALSLLHLSGTIQSSQRYLVKHNAKGLKQSLMR